MNNELKKYISLVTDPEAKEIVKRNIDLMKYKSTHPKENILGTGENIHWFEFVKNELNISQYNSLLDVGCGTLEWSRRFNVKGTVGIDSYDGVRQLATKYSSKFILMEAEDILERFGENSFDAVMEFDFIEHVLDVEHAIKIIDDMEKIARNLVLHMIPLDSIETTGSKAGILEHKKPWKHCIQLTPEFFAERGYETNILCGDMKKIFAWKVLDK